MSALVYYGAPALPVAKLELDWHEFMHYLYLPVHMASGDRVLLPSRLEFLREAVGLVMTTESQVRGSTRWLDDHYIYVTAKHGFASPGHPLNRPGWHSDGFGSDDVNYVWTDRFPTVFAHGVLTNVSDDHVLSLEQFRAWANGTIGRGGSPATLVEGPVNELLRLDPLVIHQAPTIPAPGGERSFLKVSISKSRYNLRGNSHNYLFDYDWKMWERGEVRNDPAFAGGDVGPQS